MSRQSIVESVRVLVIDDHAVSRRFIRSALLQSHCSVKQTADPGVARRWARDWRPDVILTDLNLRDQSGLEFIRQLREHNTPPQTLPRLLVMSADDSPATRARCKQTGADAFLAKPSSARAIREAVLGAVPCGIGEPDTGEVEMHIRELFHPELKQQLVELDRHIAELDTRAASDILHQLIASSAMCGDRPLEILLRQLSGACEEPLDPALLADTWFESRRRCADYLAGLSRTDPLQWSG